MTIELNQSNLLRTKKIELTVDSEVLQVKKSSIFSSESYKIPLERISKDPVLFRKITWSWLAAAVFIALLTIIPINNLIQGELTIDQTKSAKAFIVMGIIVVALFIIQCSRQSFHGLIYRDAGSDATLFYIHPSRPNRQAVNNFIDKLSSLIEKKYFSDDVPFHQKVGTYKKHLQFLLDEQVLTDSEVSNAIQRLENKTKGSSVIGLVK